MSQAFTHTVTEQRFIEKPLWTEGLMVSTKIKDGQVLVPELQKLAVR